MHQQQQGPEKKIIHQLLVKINSTKSNPTRLVPIEHDLHLTSKEGFQREVSVSRKMFFTFCRLNTELLTLDSSIQMLIAKSTSFGKPHCSERTSLSKFLVTSVENKCSEMSGKQNDVITV